MEDFYGTGIEIWAGFGLVGITEKKICNAILNGALEVFRILCVYP